MKIPNGKTVDGNKGLTRQDSTASRSKPVAGETREQRRARLLAQQRALMGVPEDYVPPTEMCPATVSDPDAFLSATESRAKLRAKLLAQVQAEDTLYQGLLAQRALFAGHDSETVSEVSDLSSEDSEATDDEDIPRLTEESASPAPTKTACEMQDLVIVKYATLLKRKIRGPDFKRQTKRNIKPGFTQCMHGTGDLIRYTNTVDAPTPTPGPGSYVQSYSSFGLKKCFTKACKGTFGTTSRPQPKPALGCYIQSYSSFGMKKSFSTRTQGTLGKTSRAKTLIPGANGTVCYATSRTRSQTRGPGAYTPMVDHKGNRVRARSHHPRSAPAPVPRRLRKR